jgi:hypothetical protein
MKDIIYISLLRTILECAVSISVAASRIGERLVRGRRAYLVYQRRYGFHA